MAKKFTQYEAATVIADSDVDLTVQNVPTTPVSRKRPFSLIKSTLKTYFDSLYSSLPIAIVDGLTLSNNVSDANNDIDIAAGKAADSAGTENMVLSSSLTKRLDAVWAVGTNQGGLDTGTKANSTWYHVWLIKRPDTGVVDVLFSTSATAPTMPTSYTKKRRIGAVKTNGSGNIIAFLQYGDEFLWLSPPALDVDTAVLSTTRTNYTLASVPSGIVVSANINAGCYNAAARMIYISNPNLTDLAPSTSVTPLATIASSAGLTNTLKLYTYTNASAQISAVANGASTTFKVAVLGWEDPRGKW